MFCWVLGLLVLPRLGALRWMVRVPLVMHWVSLPPVSPLAPGVSTGDSVVAFGLGGVGGGAVVGVAVTSPGCGLGRGWSLGVAGCGPSPVLAEGLVGGAVGWSTLSVLVVFLAALQLSSRRVAGFLFFGFACVVCVCGAGGARALVCCVCWRLWWCVLCARGCVCGVLVVRLGARPRLPGLELAALCGWGGCVWWSLSRPGLALALAFGLKQHLWGKSGQL